MCTQAGQASAQIQVNATNFGVSTPNVIVYGQPTIFSAALVVNPTDPLPTGNLLFQQGNEVLATAPLATAGTPGPPGFLVRVNILDASEDSLVRYLARFNG